MAAMQGEQGQLMGDCLRARRAGYPLLWELRVLFEEPESIGFPRRRVARRLSGQGSEPRLGASVPEDGVLEEGV